MATLKFVFSHDDLKQLMEKAESIDGAKKLLHFELDFDTNKGIVEPTLHATNLHKLANGTLQPSALGASGRGCPNPPCGCC
jgi:hypothetical protein